MEQSDSLSIILKKCEAFNLIRKSCSFILKIYTVFKHYVHHMIQNGHLKYIYNHTDKREN